MEADAGLYFLDTALTWVLQTFLRLRSAGAAVALSDALPASGVIVTFSGCLAFDYVPAPRQFLVSASGDAPSHPFAHLHVTQNREQTRWLRNSVHIPHWPQPGLVARDASRGDRFERVAFFGDPVNLGQELQDDRWRAELAALGIDWVVRQAAEGRDYSDIDAVVAIRSFQKRGYIRKPASKLYNAWLAGAPAILGDEFAFREQRRSPLDYLEARSFEGALQAVKALKSDLGLRRRMVENGRRRAAEVSTAAITEAWRSLLFERAAASFDRWAAASAAQQRRFRTARVAEKRMRGLAFRALRALGAEQNAL